jgi:predicted permease
MLRIFGIPAALAVISLAGLVAALVWDGPREQVAVLAAAMPVAAFAWALGRRQS